MFASKDIFLKSSGGYQISRSVRLRQSASAYFSRTNTNPPTNAKIGTLSMWLKRGSLATGNSQYLVETGTGTSNNTHFQLFFQTSNDLAAGQYSETPFTNTSVVFRDPSAWYHIVITYDSTQATASNRFKLYINNQLFTSSTTITQNNEWAILQASQLINIGRHTSVGRHFDGYLTEINLIDGQALTPSSFGETNTVTGVWQPIKYTGTYGTNGFYLNFSDNSGVTATTIGKDYSGNGNNWTPSAGISITAGATYDSMLDVPTPYADGGNGRGNYAVLNPVDLGYIAALSEANLKVSTASAGNAAAGSTIAMSGNTYWEVTIGSNSQVGLLWGRASDAYGNSSISMFASGATGSLNNATRTLSATPSWSNGDTLGLAWNSSTRVLTLYQAGSATAVMTILTPATGDPQAAVVNYTSGAVMSSQVNFGQRPFTYTPPTGFVALNTQNLPTPTISNGATVMAATLWTGNGTSQSISNAVNGVSFQPDFVWIKDRSVARSHILTDAVRGTTKQLYSNETTDEATNSDRLTAFNSNGFNVGTGLGVNASAETFVGWQWNAGGSTVTNTSGTISAQVRANATAGFSVVTYTGNGVTAATVGHGLNAIPAMVIIKERGTAGTNWMVKHQSLASSNNLFLQGTNATTNITTAVAGGGIANLSSSTTFNFLAGTSNTDNVNRNTGTFVAYCFSAVAGYSAFGSYTGNGVADGVFVYLGFRPRFIMIKSTSASTEWVMIDTSRSSYNLSETSLYANRDYSESTIGTVNDIDILSNGFKLRNNTGFVNASQTYIYAAFSEVGFKYALGR